MSLPGGIVAQPHRAVTLPVRPAWKDLALPDVPPDAAAPDKVNMVGLICKVAIVALVAFQTPRAGNPVMDYACTISTHAIDTRPAAAIMGAMCTCAVPGESRARLPLPSLVS